MTKKISFVGDPGETTGAMLGVIREAGFDPERIKPHLDASKWTESVPPVLFILADGIADRCEVIATIRENAALAQVPLLSLVKTANPDYVNDVLAEGADDFMIEGDMAHLRLLLAVLQKSDSWHAVRAPAGLVVLAEEDRSERVRLAHVLKRNGFDIRFAADAEDLKSAIEATMPRAVITSRDLPGGGVVDVLTSMGVGTEIACVLLASGADAQVPTEFRGRKVAMLERGCDPQQLTFVMNELLMPPPPNVRRTPRILYSTPVFIDVLGAQMSYAGAAYNINLNGLFVRTLAPLPMQTIVETRFRPPYGRGEVCAKAQVMWVRAADQKDSSLSPPGMGLQFIEWAPADLAAFEMGYGMARQHTESNAVSYVPTSAADVTKPPPPAWSPVSVMERTK